MKKKKILENKTKFKDNFFFVSKFEKKSIHGLKEIFLNKVYREIH